MNIHIYIYIYAQHPGKLEYCNAFGGAGSRAIERELARGYYLRGKHFHAAKHLGMLTSGNGSLRDEKLARVKAVRHAWYSFQRFWYQPTPLCINILVFRCLVYEAAVAGWTVVAPSKADTAMLVSIVVFFCS